MSLRPSTHWPVAPACSGLMYAGVPTMSPVWVSVSPAWCTARAIPKSTTSACPRDNMMFSGLISRWMMPAEWAHSRASATS